jgi:hypothetical protein
MFRALDRSVNPFIAVLAITIIGSGLTVFITQAADALSVLEAEQAIYLTYLQH